jgi:magnesium-transporting ATPase (P-type)
MRDVKLKLQADNPTIYQRQKVFHRILESLNLVVLLLFSLPVSLLGYFVEDNFSSTLESVYIAMRIGSFLYMLAIFIVFIRLLLYFKHRKTEQYEMKRISELQVKKSALQKGVVVAFAIGLASAVLFQEFLAVLQQFIVIKLS